MRKIPSIFLILCLILPLISNFVNAERVEVEEQNGVWIFLEGGKNDEFTIILHESTHPVDIWILSQSNYQNYFTGQSFEIEWKVEGVTKGEWTWEMKNNDQWIFLINNPNNVSTEVDYSLKNDNETISLEDSGLLLLICLIMIIIMIPIIILLLIVLVIFIIRKNQTKKLDQPNFSIVEDN